MTLKSTPFVAILGALITGWLCTSSAKEVIESAMGNQPPDVADLVQRWGVTLAIIGTVVGAIAAKAISGYWSFRRSWQEQQDKFEDARRARAEILAHQGRHDEEIKQLNAIQPTPLPTIQPPVKPPTP